MIEHFDTICQALEVNNKGVNALAEQQPAKPAAWANPNDLQNFDMKVRTNGGPLHTVPLYTHPAAQQAAESVTDTNKQFNATIDFAIEQGSEAALFLRHWREGDTEEWPEFDDYLATHNITGSKT